MKKVMCPLEYICSYSAFAKFSYADFTLGGLYSSRTKGIPTASFGTDFNDPRNKTTDGWWFVDRVLVVDDDRRMVKTICDIPSVKGYEAVETARTRNLQCVLCWREHSDGGGF